MVKNEFTMLKWQTYSVLQDTCMIPPASASHTHSLANKSYASSNANSWTRHFIT